jgi:predicted dehydrogenase
MNHAVEAAMIGAGNRGTFAYGSWALAHPEVIRFTAVAEPRQAWRRRFAALHGIPPERQFASGEELLARGRIAEGLFVCSGDSEHLADALPAIELGYDLMLEKPIATTLGDCLRLARAARRKNARVTVAHVLRYTPFFSELHRLCDPATLGEPVCALHRENVCYWHMAHSFVRGNWRSSTASSPMILAKCCHDLDLLGWNLGRVTRLSSFGSLEHFRAERAPAGAPQRCTDGCPAEAECPYFAPRLYLGEQVGWPVNAICEDLSLEGRRRALETGPYGRCVFRCDNDVVDHQTVCLELASGASAVLQMHGHSYADQRTVRIDGTRASLRGLFFKEGGNRIDVHHHLRDRHQALAPDGGDDAHGGGDDGIMRAFATSARERAGGALTGIEASLESHLLAFAAEEARLTGRVVELAEFCARAEETA